MPKRYGNIYCKIYDFKNLECAYKKARRCKRYRDEVLQYSANLEENLLNTQNHLIWKSYHQGEPRMFYVREPKLRLISALPFRDRVVQHAINNIIEPILEKRLYFYSYACRRKKGMHRAAQEVSRTIRNLSFKDREVWVLKGDIHHYFQSISHAKLKWVLRRVFKDKDLLWLLDLIIDSNHKDSGIPVGNLTSQLFANLFLDGLDRFIKEILGLKHYVRYMDDFLSISNNRAELEDALQKITIYLREELGLELNPKTQIFKVTPKRGIDFCGYIIWKDHQKVRKSSVYRMRRRIRAYRRGKISRERLLKSSESWLGHIQHANTYRIKQKIQEEISRALKGGEKVGND